MSAQPSTTSPSSVSEKLISPQYIGHFGTRTTPDKFEAMIKWHCNFFGGHVVLRTPLAAFIAWDDEHHREVIIVDPNANTPAAPKAGVYHIAFTLRSIRELVMSYKQKKALGIEPHWPVNHGISTSMYYADPAGNEFELQVDNFDTVEETRNYLFSSEYAENPIGVDLVVEDLIRRVESGEDEASIKKRANIGPRLSRWDNSIYFKTVPVSVKAT